MNKLQSMPSVEGNGIYGWDLINPYLQELYRNQEEGADGDLPAYTVPLPGENRPAGAGAAPSHQVTVPLQPDFPVNPDPKVEEPRKLQSLTEGLNLAGKRIWNDLKYSKGYIQDLFSDDKSDAAKSALEHLPEYAGSTPEQLQQKADSLGREPEQKPVDRPRIELEGLEEYRRLQGEGLPQGEIARQLSETARWGNEGRRIMEEARATENAFPETEGAAVAGEILSEVARMGIPVALGAISAPVGVAAGVASVGSSVAESHAQAQMELDNYEEETGEPLSAGQRAAYTAISMGADFLFDALLQSRYLGNLSRGVKRRASQYFKDALLKNKEARREATKLMNSLHYTDFARTTLGVVKDAGVGAVSEGANSAIHDVGRMVYVNPEDYPTLSSILQNAAVGMAAGATVGTVAGGLGRVVNRRRNVALRDRQEIIGTLEYDGFTTDVVDYDPETRTATVMHPQYEKPVKVPDVDIDMMRPISTGELKQRAREARALHEPDPLETVLRDPAKDQAWREMSTRGKYHLTKDLADRMGLDNVYIYEHQSDLPDSFSGSKDRTIAGFYRHNGIIGIVLDNIRSYDILQHVLLHEAVGHRGLDALFGNAYFRDEFLMKVYRSMPDIWKLSGSSWEGRKSDAAEYLADMAGSAVQNSVWKDICTELRGMLRIFWPGMRFSDGELNRIIMLSRNALRDDISISELNKMTRRQLGEVEYNNRLGTPLTEVEREPYLLLWEEDPQWQRYKRFYDEVYGQPQKRSNTNPPEPSAGN